MALAPSPLLRAAVALAFLAAPCSASPWLMQHFSTGTSFNHTLAVGDLDGDGDPDVACPNSQASAVSVLLGNGDGTLAGVTAYPTFAEPQDVVMAELTGDGLLDLATADYSSGGITLLRGLGDGTFAPRTAYAAGAGLVALVAVDLDADSRLDLAISRESGNRLVVLPALAGGGFGAPLLTSTGSGPHQVASADFDGDSALDMAVVGFAAGTVSIHAGDGTHTMGMAMPHVCGAAPIGLVAADLDADGTPDLLVTNVNAATLTVLIGRGDGTFDPPVAYPTGARPRGMDTGDLDGDGLLDVVIATGYPDGDSLLTVYRGAGGGRLTPSDALRLPYRAADCVIADLDDDGWRDIVATGPQAGVVTVLRNPGATVDVPRSLPASVRRLELQPNPARGAVQMRVSVPQGESAIVDVLDLGGRFVTSLSAGDGGSEARRLTWQPDASLRPGVYLARLRGTSVMRRVVVLGQ